MTESLKSRAEIIDSMLVRGAENGEFELIKISLEKGATASLLFDKIRSSYFRELPEDIVQLALDKGATAQDLLYTIASTGSSTYLDLALSKGAKADAPAKDGQPLLYHACKGGQFKLCDILLKNGASIEARLVSGQSLLDYFLKAGDGDAVRYCLRNGADTRTTDANKLLAFGISSKSDACVNAAISSGADVNGKIMYKGEMIPVIHYAHAMFSKPVMLALSKANIDIDAVNAAGRTVLMMSIRSIHPESWPSHEVVASRVGEYISMGANPLLPDTDGTTPLEHFAKLYPSMGGLLAKMMQNIKDEPVEIKPDFDDVATKRDIRVSKPLKIKPPQAS